MSTAEGGCATRVYLNPADAGFRIFEVVALNMPSRHWVGSAMFSNLNDCETRMIQRSLVK
jgi:hypothetical protein